MGKWNFKALQEALQLLHYSQETNFSTIRPIEGVGIWKGICYLAYEAVNNLLNESPDTLHEERAQKCSHLLPKGHEVSVNRLATARPAFDPRRISAGRDQVICNAGLLPSDLSLRYQHMLEQIFNKFDKFVQIPIQIIHGDTYFGSVVWKSDEPIIPDFDDFRMSQKSSI